MSTGTVRSSRNVTREVQRLREESPVVAMHIAPLGEDGRRPKTKPSHPKRNWEESFQALVDYKKQKGNCNVPRHDKEDPGLAYWVHKQRSNRNCSKKMTPEQRDQLTQLEFDWGTKEEKNECS
jgi:hypothetical protein